MSTELFSLILLIAFWNPGPYYARLRVYKAYILSDLNLLFEVGLFPREVVRAVLATECRLEVLGHVLRASCLSLPLCLVICIKSLRRQGHLHRSFHPLSVNDLLNLILEVLHSLAHFLLIGEPLDGVKHLANVSEVALLQFVEVWLLQLYLQEL